MISLVQRVRSATVRIRDGGELASIGAGMVVLLGIEVGDGPDQAAWMARRLRGLRIFEDSDGRMNRDVVESGGRAIVVSQFTLAADASGGNRPSFVGAARPEVAEPLVDEVVALLRAAGLEVGTGRFGARMEVELINDGPVTIPLRTPKASIAA